MEHSPSRARLDPLVNKHLRRNNHSLMLKSPSRNDSLNYMGHNSVTGGSLMRRKSLVTAELLEEDISINEDDILLPKIQKG